MIYINLEILLFKNENDESFMQVAGNLDEACKLVRVGFEYFTEYSGGKIFRK